MFTTGRKEMQICVFILNNSVYISKYYLQFAKIQANVDIEFEVCKYF